MMRRFAILRLEGPLVAFGGVTVDIHGVVRDFPAASMLTGLLANALGWRHGDAERLSRLQERLVFGARLDRPGTRIVDFQTAQIGKNDRGWTTRGLPEGRAGGADQYASPLLRYRHYQADASCIVAFTLEPPNEKPTLDEAAHALNKPARPLFIGRKGCLPTAPLHAGFLEADTILQALQLAPSPVGAKGEIRAFWPEGEGDEPLSQPIAVSDRRDWHNQVHVGERVIRQGRVVLT